MASPLFLSRRENPASPDWNVFSVNEGNIHIDLDPSNLFAQNNIWKRVVRFSENPEEGGLCRPVRYCILLTPVYFFFTFYFFPLIFLYYSNEVITSVVV